MSYTQLKKYIPDSAKELSFIGSSLVRLGTVLTGISAVQESLPWTLVCALLTWIGHEMTMYFKIHEKKKAADRENHKPK